MSESTPVYVDCKQCQTCKQVKSLSQFGRKGTGHRRVCLPCVEASREADTKTCIKCGEDKPIGEFVPGRNVCNDPCWLADKRDRYWADPKRAGQERPEYVQRVHRPAPDGHKWCTKCDDCKPFDQFNRTKYGGCQGYTSWCISCMTTHKMKQARENPEVHAARNAASRRWHERNPEFAVRYRQENAEMYREFSRSAAGRRRSRLLDLPFEKVTMAQLLERDGNACVLCGEDLDLAAVHPDPWSPTIEHLEPIAWGPGRSGGHTASNCAVAHFTCNVRRRDRPHPAAARKRAELLAAEQAVTTT